MSEKRDDDQKSEIDKMSDDKQNVGGEQEKYSFLQETFKDEQVTTKSIWRRIAKTAGRGAIFGIAACLVFCALKPRLEPFFSRPGKVTIPEDTENSIPKNPGEGEEEADKGMTVEDYQELHKALYELTLEAEKSVVEVSQKEESENDRTNEENTYSVSGIIIWNERSEILVLVPARAVRNDKPLQVKFADGSTYEASLKKRDLNLGMAVLSVNRRNVTEMTLAKIKTAVFGNSNLTEKGDPVVALGEQFGYSGGVGYGIITSDNNEKIMADRACRILSTDIATSATGSGVLFNIDGEVIGLIDQFIGEKDERNLMTAYAVSDIKKEIELLSNGKSIPYLGITGVEVTDEISAENELPHGIYVNDVAADSPAMAAGIQSGDVLTSLDEKRISTISGYEKALMQTETGREIKVNGLRRGADQYVKIEFNVTIGSKE